jgi:hypothetical protein
MWVKLSNNMVASIMQKIPMMVEWEREREYLESRNSNDHISVFHRWISWVLDILCSSPPLTSDHWDQRIWFCVSDIAFATFQEKTYLQVSHGRWQFPSLSTIGSWYIWDMLVIWMSSNLIRTNKIQMVKLTHQMTKLHIVFYMFSYCFDVLLLKIIF